MSEVGHDIHAPFFGEASHLRVLKVESGLGAASDARFDDPKRQRLYLLDLVAEMVAERKGK